jgi:hypothetical protein
MAAISLPGGSPGISTSRERVAVPKGSVFTGGGAVHAGFLAGQGGQVQVRIVDEAAPLSRTICLVAGWNRKDGLR